VGSSAVVSASAAPPSLEEEEEEESASRKYCPWKVRNANTSLDDADDAGAAAAPEDEGPASDGDDEEGRSS
jgi:hypothetical protein